MASKITIEFAVENAKGNIDLDGDTFNARLCLSNTTCDTENAGIFTVGNYTTPDFHSGAAPIALTNIAVNKDEPNLRAEFDADDVTFAALAADVSGRNVVGVLICKQIDSGNGDIPCFYLEYATPKTPDGSNFVIQWDAEGIAQLTVPA